MDERVWKLQWTLGSLWQQQFYSSNTQVFLKYLWHFWTFVFGQIVQSKIADFSEWDQHHNSFNWHISDTTNLPDCVRLCSHRSVWKWRTDIFNALWEKFCYIWKCQIFHHHWWLIGKIFVYRFVGSYISSSKQEISYNIDLSFSSQRNSESQMCKGSLEWFWG